MADLPSGTVTFLFTDLEGSTRLWEKYPEAMQSALARHDTIVRKAIESHGGVVVKTTGDGFHAVFVSAPGALAAAVAAQRRLGSESWGSTGPLAVRIGLHSGAAEFRGGDYPGPTVNRAARVMSVAHGGQVLVSGATAELVRDGPREGAGLMDLGEHRLRDLGRPERLFQVRGPGLRVSFPPLGSLDVLPNNLPEQLTSFVGREQEVACVVGALREYRVVTLTGTGGVGKSRLGLQVAGELVAEFRDGVWLCQLAPIRDPDAVPAVVAGVVGVDAQPGQAMTDAVIERLRYAEVLLVLDNCEHLLDPVARLVAAIERACPRVAVLASSREGLDIEGERVVAVTALGLPEPDSDVEAIEHSAAVRLFVERARAGKEGFWLGPENAESVADLCRRLDGLPLAIELAAARVAAFTPAELLERLDHRFRVLTGSRRTGEARHRTLHATIDWSYQLLEEREQRLFERLAVFAGGCTLAAAEAVAAGRGLERDDIWDLVARLVARSLVVADDDVIETRYRLLESIREYALERLHETGDAEHVHTAQARYYAAFVQAAVPALAGRDELVWTTRIDRDLDNIRVALDWAIRAADADTAVRILSCASAPSPAYVSGFNRTIDPAAESVLRIPGATEDPKFPEALVAAAWLAANRGDTELAVRHCHDAQRAAEDPTVVTPYVWVTRGAIATMEGHSDELLQNFERAVAGYRAREDPELPTPLANLANIRYAVRGHAPTAVSEALEALELARRSGAPHVIAIALATAGAVLADAEPQRALALMHEAIELEDSLGHRSNAHPLIIVADFTRRHGDARDALELYARVYRHSHYTQWGGGRPLLESTLQSVGQLLVPDAPEDAATLIGAGTLRKSGIGAEELQRALATLTAVLGDQDVTALCARGHDMDPDEAVTYAQDAIARVLRN